MTTNWRIWCASARGGPEAWRDRVVPQRDGDVEWSPAYEPPTDSQAGDGVFDCCPTVDPDERTAALKPYRSDLMLCLGSGKVRQGQRREWSVAPPREQRSSWSPFWFQCEPSNVRRHEAGRRPTRTILQ
jgi:hypothetical protein